MEGDANQMSQATLCRSGCGFYGNPAQDGLCSKCFKDSVKRKQSAPPVGTSSSSSATAGRNSPSAVAAAAAAVAAAAAAAGSSSSDNNHSPCTPPELLSMTTASPTVLPSILLLSSSSSSSSNPDLHVGESEQKGGTEGATGAADDDAAATLEGGAHAGLESMDTDASQEASDFSQQLDKQKKRNRCQMCRKKVGLTGFECRCGGLFCSLHRYSDKHECSFDYKQLGAQEIRKNNPIVVGEKIQKI